MDDPRYQNIGEIDDPAFTAKMEQARAQAADSLRTADEWFIITKKGEKTETFRLMQWESICVWVEALQIDYMILWHEHDHYHKNIEGNENG